MKQKGLIVVGIVVFVVVLLLLGPMIYGIFQLDATALRVWAVVVTLALPCVAGMGYMAGRGTAKTALDGLNLGVEKVMLAAERAANIKDRSFKKTVQHARPQFNVAMLPQTQIQHRLTDGSQEVEL